MELVNGSTIQRKGNQTPASRPNVSLLKSHPGASKPFHNGNKLLSSFQVTKINFNWEVIKVFKIELYKSSFSIKHSEKLYLMKHHNATMANFT